MTVFGSLLNSISPVFMFSLSLNSIIFQIVKTVQGVFLEIEERTAMSLVFKLLLSLQLLFQFSGAVEFRDGSSYNLEEFELMTREALSDDLALDPFCKSIMNSFVSDDGSRSFLEFIVDDFEHEMARFDPKLPQSWDTLLNLAFNAFGGVERELALSILREVVIPSYPILSNVEEVIIDFDCSLVSSALDESVLYHFHDKLVTAEPANIKNLLLDAKNSCANLDEAFKYHYAFLNKIPIEYFYDFPSITLCSDVECYFAKLAKNVYENVYKVSRIEARNVLCWILPDVYDKIKKDFDNYEKVISAYVKDERQECDTEPFVTTMREYLNVIDPIEMKILHDIALNTNHKLTNFAARHFSIILDDECTLDCLFYSLSARFSSIYPEYGYKIPCGPSIIRKYSEGLLTKCKHHESAKYLITTSNNNKNSLTAVTRQGSFSIFAVLIDKYSESLMESDWRRLLDIASENGHWNIATFILEKYPQAMNLNSFEYFLEDDFGFNLVQKALTDGFVMDQEATVSVLEAAAKYGNYAIVEHLISKGFRFKVKDVMDYAAFYGHFGIVKYLFEHRNEASSETVSDRDYFGDALRFACTRGKLEVIEYIFEVSKVAIHLIEPKSIAIAFVNASFNGNETIMKLICDRFPGGGIEEFYGIGLIEASSTDRPDIVKHILNKNLLIESNSIKSALKIAKKRKHLEIIDLIKSSKKLLI